jgi:phthalate 4,5-dioxygenase oxygenase subunit
MLSQADNDFLCRVGAHTPMGSVLREYWIPFLTSDELPSPDGPPVRVRLLGENLLAFRVTSGDVGLIQDACPHRGASLFFGRNEAGGLRCVYHGWKFDTSGACVDMPNVPPKCAFTHKIKATAYPCCERNGVLWTYMGSRTPVPALPDLEANENSQGTSVTRIMRDCNWVQALEGDLDPSHLSFAHRRLDFEPSGWGRYLLRNPPSLEVIDTQVGIAAIARYPADEDSLYLRISHFLLPFYAMVGAGQFGREVVVRAWVPLDDQHTMFWQMGEWRTFDPRDTTSGLKARAIEYLPSTTDWLGTFRLTANMANDYHVDREAQRKHSFTGIIAPAPVEDQAITESMGPICDRSREHLGPADSAIIAMRQRLFTAAKTLRATGASPPGVDTPGSYRVQSGGITLPPNAEWRDVLSITTHA